MKNESKETELILKLLSETTSLQIVRDFLKDKGLSHSAGSWDDIATKRINPAIQSNEISNDDLITLLQSVEESGHQHVFLYKCSKDKAIELMDRTRIHKILKSENLEDLLVSPKILDQPASAQIVDVRWKVSGVDQSLTIKEVEPRKFQTFIGTELHNNQIHKIYGLEEQRAVNLAKLHRDGLLEIRIASLANSSKNTKEISRLLSALNKFLPFKEFKELSLSKVKQRIWVDRAELGALIRYSDTTLRDEGGNILKAATGSETEDLGANVIFGESLDHLLDKDQSAYCAGANIWFKKNNELSTDIHVLLTGEVNEFALPANCTENDYNYVLTQLRLFNN